MKLKSVPVLGALALAVLSMGRFAAAEDAQYKFTVGETPVYEIKVKAEYPGQIHTEVAYVLLNPLTIDSEGTTKLVYRFGIKTKRVQTGTTTNNEGFAGLASMFEPIDANKPGPAITIDPRGTVIDNEGELNGAQLEATQGSAWKVILQPLPPAGKTTWEVKQPMSLYEPQRGPGGFPVGNAPPAYEIPANAVTTYTAGAATGDTMTVQRHYDLATDAQAGGNSEHMHGDGQYVFDLKTGRVSTLHWALADDIKHDTLSVSVPITVDARLLQADEVAKIKESVASETAKIKAKNTPDQMYDGGDKVTNLHEMPPGLEATDIVGGHGGGDNVNASADRKPVVGFRVKTSEWFGKSAIQVMDPIYNRPKDKPKDDDKAVGFVIAREGYAVGSITVNADTDGVHALYITFMKMTDDGLDTKQSYTSPWIGKKVGTQQRKLSGNGKFIYGVCGRKGINYDAIGLVTEAPPAEDTAK